MRAATQEQTANALNDLGRPHGETTAITGNHISRWERGVVHPSRLHCQLRVEHFGATLAELRLARQRVAPTDRFASIDADGDPLLIENTDHTKIDQRVIESQAEWLHLRRSLNVHHMDLAQTAAQLYPEAFRIGT